MASLGYKLPLLDYQEEEIAVPSVQMNLGHCRSIWRPIRSALLC